MEIIMTIGKTPDDLSVFTGFRYIWLRYVHGFNPHEHCQRSLLGRNDTRFTNRMEIGRSFVLEGSNGYKHIYLCGEASVPNSGLHLALLPEDGATAEVTTYNGIRIVVKNTRKLEIPALSDGYESMSHHFTSCVNWQFGVAYYGISDLKRGLVKNVQPINKISFRMD